MRRAAAIALAGYANAAARYLMGEEPAEGEEDTRDLLQRVVLVSGVWTPTAADPVPFVHDAADLKAVATEAGLQVEDAKVVYVTGTRPAVGEVYTHGGRRWQVRAADYDRCAGADWPHRVELLAHV